MNDPRGTRERLSVIPLGCRTYLNAKADRDGSMFEKAGCSETIRGHARRDPDGMVKVGLPEPQWPNCKFPGWTRWLTSSALVRTILTCCTAPHAPESWVGGRQSQGHE